MLASRSVIIRLYIVKTHDDVDILSERWQEVILIVCGGKNMRGSTKLINIQGANIRPISRFRGELLDDDDSSTPISAPIM